MVECGVEQPECKHMWEYTWYENTSMILKGACMLCGIAENDFAR